MNKKNENSIHLPKLACWILVALLFGISCATGWAQQPSDVFSREGLDADQIRPITLWPAKPADPVLTYRLFPNSPRQIKRNAAVFYHRAMHSYLAQESGLEKRNQKRPRDDQIATTKNRWIAWTKASLEQLPVAELKRWLSFHEAMFNDLERARVSAYCEWGILPESTEGLDWFMLPLSELQTMRQLARVLALAAKVKIAEGNYGDAIQLLQTGYKLAHDLESSNLLVGSLIGFACTNVMEQPLLWLMKQEAAPSFYWPLATMPHPVVSSREAFRRELDWILGGAAFQTLANPERRHWSTDEWQRALRADNERMSAYRRKTEPPEIYILRGYPIAKQALVRAGFDADTVDEMPAIQVVAIQQKRVMRRVHDEAVKWLNLPDYQVDRQSREFEEMIDRLSVDQPPTAETSLLPFLDMLLPTVGVIRAEIRGQQRLAAIQVIEALRLHLGETGQLPDRLSDISVVPVPLNPRTNQVFDYRKSALGIAELVIVTEFKSGNVIYEITVGKRK